jgi:hypothetical protein
MPNGDHAAAASSFLTRKIGPLPAWAYGVAAAVVVGVVVLYQRGRSTTAAGTAASTQASSPYASSAQGQLNYPPTVVVTPGGLTNTVATPSVQPSGTTATAVSPSTITLISTPRFGELASQPGPPIYSLTGQLLSGAAGPYLPWGSTYTVDTGSMASAQGVIPIKGPGGKTYGVSQLDIASWGGGSGGFGGARAGNLATRGHSGMGGPLGHFTPFQPSQYIHTGRGGADGMGGMGDGMGGGGGHGAIMAIARRTGINQYRLLSLNSHLRRPDGSYARGVVRIA